MQAERPYWNMEAEPALDGAAVREVQLAKLRRLVERLYERKPFWRERLVAADLAPGKLRSLADFTRVPVFDKAQRRELLAACGGDVIELVDRTIGTDLVDLRLMAATSGTTGEPTPYPMTARDMEWFSENLCRILWRIGVRPGSRLCHAFGLSMFLAGMPYAQLFERSGACILPVGAEAGSEKILRFARTFRVDTIACTPSLAEHLIERAPEVLGAGAGSLKVKRLLCGGEPGAGIPEVRAKLERGFGAPLFDTGAGFGVSCDQPDYQGMHHVADDNLLFELVDPDTYEPIPMEHGAIGMPVQTTLEGEGFLWFREAIGDVCQVFTRPCPCGRTGFRYRMIGRRDDMLKIKGVVVYPSAVEGVIGSLAPRVTGAFRIVLDEPPPRVVPPLKLRVEHAAGIAGEELRRLEADLVERMHQRLRVTPAVEWLPPGTLPRFTHKTVLLEKRYEDGATGDAGAAATPEAARRN